MSHDAKAVAVVPAVGGMARLPDAETWGTITRMAKAFWESGMLPSSIKSPQAAALIIQKGSELRLPPVYALQNIHVIEGSPTADAQVLAALIYRDHGDDALIPGESTTERASYRYKRRGWANWQEFSYTIEDAKLAGLLGKRNWQTNPRAMLRARCVSAIGRLAFQDTVGGLYLDEEVERSPEPAITVAPQPASMPASAAPTTESQPADEAAVDAAFRDVPAESPDRLSATNLQSLIDFARARGVGWERVLAHAEEQFDKVNEPTWTQEEGRALYRWVKRALSDHEAAEFDAFDQEETSHV